MPFSSKSHVSLRFTPSCHRNERRIRRPVPAKPALTISPLNVFVSVHQRKSRSGKFFRKIFFRLKIPPSRNSCRRQTWRPRSRSRSALSRCPRAASRHSPDCSGNSAEIRTTTDMRCFIISISFPFSRCPHSIPHVKAHSHNLVALLRNCSDATSRWRHGYFARWADRSRGSRSFPVSFTPRLSVSFIS